MTETTTKPVRFTRSQENALVAAVAFPPDSPAFGVIRRAGPRLVRALTLPGLYRLKEAGLVAEWRSTDGTDGACTSVRLNRDGVALAQDIARKRNPDWEPEPPQYEPSASADAIDGTPEEP